MNYGIKILNDIIKNFSKDTIRKAEKYINFSDVTKNLKN